MLWDLEEFTFDPC